LAQAGIVKDNRGWSKLSDAKQVCVQDRFLAAIRIEIACQSPLPRLLLQPSSSGSV
jgi:hypothetical protein